MRNEHTCHVCPNCGAVATVERTTCSECGQPTALKVTRASESRGKSGASLHRVMRAAEARRLRGSMADRVDASANLKCRVQVLRRIRDALTKPSRSGLSSDSRHGRHNLLRRG